MSTTKSDCSQPAARPSACPAPRPAQDTLRQSQGRHAREILEEHGLGGEYQRLVDAGVVVVDGIKAG